MSKKELLLNYKMKAKPIMMKSLSVYAFEDNSKHRKEFENKFRNYIYFDGSGITRDKKVRNHIITSI